MQTNIDFILGLIARPCQIVITFFFHHIHIYIYILWDEITFWFLVTSAYVNTTFDNNNY